MAVSLAAYMSACIRTLAYRMHYQHERCCLLVVFVCFVSWGLWSWPVFVCIVCLLLERTVTHLSVSNKTKQTTLY